MKKILVERTKSGLHSALSSELPSLPQDASILDIGCGTGAWLERLAVLGYSNLYGVDLDIEQFATDKAKGFQLNLDHDNMPDFDIEKFDLITAIEFIEHLENPGRLFVHISRLLKPDGYALITTPNIHSLIARLRFLLSVRLKAFDEKGDPTHIYPIYLPCLERILPRYDLQVIKISTYPKKGSIVSGKFLNLAGSLLSYFLEDKFSGDNLFILIRRCNTSQDNENPHII
jgi:2-polyprenyl-3-methyl-5-hydroxy-6-metoxy-1,4-benzoquinol methylase